jgi:transglutaminase-like putative cysteine protease
VIYDVRQTTTYQYASRVGYAHHVLRLTPVNRRGQRVHVSTLDIEPAPAERREGKDFFNNHLTLVRLDHPHDRLVVRVYARVAVEPQPQEGAGSTPAWQDLRNGVFGSDDLGARSPAHFLFASRLVPLDPEIRDYARESFPLGRAVLEGALELMHRIKTDFAYEIGATTATTTAPMSFALRRGVCQDFAHIMISGLRGLGLAAAYVSGYLRTVQRADAERLTGADAMHAWVLVWCGAEIGWVGLDPTNAVVAGEDHVTLAIGRDYADVAPIDGVVFGAGRQRLGVAVSVTPVEIAA